jgi:hypothetical protein
VRLIVCGILLLVLPATCLQAEPALLYANDFESTTGALPRGWLSFGGQWGLAADDSAVLQQTLPAFRGLAQAAMQECNYQVEATVRALSCSGPWGVGVVATG